MRPGPRLVGPKRVHQQWWARSGGLGLPVPSGGGGGLANAKRASWEQSLGLEPVLVGTHMFSQNTVRFRHVWQGIIQIGNTNAFMIISR